MALNRVSGAVRVVLLAGALAIWPAIAFGEMLAPKEGLWGKGQRVKNDSGRPANDYHIRATVPAGWGFVGNPNSPGEITQVGDLIKIDWKFDRPVRRYAQRSMAAWGTLRDPSGTVQSPNKIHLHEAYWTWYGAKIGGLVAVTGFVNEARTGGGIRVGLTNHTSGTMELVNVQISIGWWWPEEKWGEVLLGAPVPPAYAFQLLSAHEVLSPGRSGVFWEFPNVAPGTPVLLEYRAAWLGSTTWSYYRDGCRIPEPAGLLVVGLGAMLIRREVRTR